MSRIVSLKTHPRKIINSINCKCINPKKKISLVITILIICLFGNISINIVAENNQTMFHKLGYETVSSKDFLNFNALQSGWLITIRNIDINC